MARIAGIDLPKDKRVEIGLTYIYGIGRTSANKILAEAGINPDTRHQAPDRDRLLPRHAASQGPARPRSALQDQRAHPQGPQAHRRQQEEVREGETHGYRYQG